MEFATENSSKFEGLSHESKTQYSPKPAGEAHSVGHGWTIRIVSRIDWGGLVPPKASLKPMHMPVTHIRLTDTGTATCSDTNECARVLREYQRKFMELGFPDQPFNFLVGGDGTVFVGRGWYKRAMYTPLNTTINEKCAEIAYIGKFKSEGPPTDMIFAALDLIKFGVKNNNVHPFFKIFEFKPISLNF